MAPSRYSWEERVQRFLAKVQITPDCWFWQGALSPSGYGHFRDQHGRTKSAHRWMWELVNWPVPEGLQIDHLCNLRGCVNPDHMQVVTGRVNTLRGNTTAGRNKRKTHCPRGHPYESDNLYIAKNGKRYCRQCVREGNMRWYYRQKESA